MKCFFWGHDWHYWTSAECVFTKKKRVCLKCERIEVYCDYIDDMTGDYWFTEDFIKKYDSDLIERERKAYEILKKRNQ